MAACASKVPVRARGPSGGVQGGAWELVVPGPEVALALAKADTSAHPAYMTRRDAALGATTPSWAPVATGAGRPTTIGRPRSISLGRSHESFLFFTSPHAWPVDHWRLAPRYTHPLPPHRYWDP